MADQVQAVIERGVADRAFPGACYAYGNLKTVHRGAVGGKTYGSEPEPVGIATLWDLASLTKVVCTTTLAMLLWEDGDLKLETPISKYLPRFGSHGKADITIRHLLVHESGLIADRPYHLKGMDRAQVLAALDDETLQYPVGTKTVYSDLNMLVLMRVIEHLSKAPFDALAAERVFHPLGMSRTRFSPPLATEDRYAPTETTEPWRQERHRRLGLDSEAFEVRAPGIAVPCICGEVHDPTAATMGGVAGHAGLFAPIEDLCAFAYALMTGKGGAGRVPKPDTIQAFTRRQGGGVSTRGLGWDTKSLTGYTSAGSRFGASSYGHTGYTGTSIWIDPAREAFAILLTNRVHPSSDNLKIAEVRPQFADACASALDF